jgi:hypothetical protein
VVVHQAVGVAQPAIAIDDMGHESEPLRPVAVIVHDVLPGIAPNRDVIDGAGKFKAKRTRLRFSRLAIFWLSNSG